MRVLFAGLLLSVVWSPLVADQPAWTLTLDERAVRRADPVTNAARHEAWVAKGRQPVKPTANVVDGSIDPTMLAPIELVERVVVFNLPGDVVAKRRREWADRGAADILGPDFWNRLQVVFAEVIAQDREYRRPGAVPLARLTNENPECAATARSLQAARAEWGRATFDRFLYEVVAPGVFFFSSSSDPAGMTTPEHWVDLWTWQEEGCR